ncbi:hypothetical protein EXIGLDRAFT_766660 [Exidia glandulosa HHB12029]|uniref:Uncharacterized protein n=1 Tax=Exidia glandulosa HHB12029 TaxID=1314781 RepID=A0A165JJ74_EXIGL|nr:hypothetical protein EXIGLDRAFT_766660 [Exidia glandulosa HHB12029]
MTRSIYRNENKETINKGIATVARPKVGEIWWATTSVTERVLRIALAYSAVHLTDTMSTTLRRVETLERSKKRPVIIMDAIRGSPTVSVVATATFGGTPVVDLDLHTQHFALPIGRTAPWPTSTSYVLQPDPNWPLSSVKPCYAIAFVFQLPISSLRYLYVGEKGSPPGDYHVQDDAFDKLNDICAMRLREYRAISPEVLIKWNKSFEARQDILNGLGEVQPAAPATILPVRPPPPAPSAPPVLRTAPARPAVRQAPKSAAVRAPPPAPPVPRTSPARPQAPPSTTVRAPPAPPAPPARRPPPISPAVSAPASDTYLHSLSPRADAFVPRGTSVAEPLATASAVPRSLLSPHARSFVPRLNHEERLQAGIQGVTAIVVAYLAQAEYSQSQNNAHATPNHYAPSNPTSPVRQDATAYPARFEPAWPAPPPTNASSTPCSSLPADGFFRRFITDEVMPAHSRFPPTSTPALRPQSMPGWPTVYATPAPPPVQYQMPQQVYAYAPQPPQQQLLYNPNQIPRAAAQDATLFNYNNHQAPPPQNFHPQQPQAGYAYAPTPSYYGY